MKKTAEDKLRQMYDDRIDTMQRIIDGLHAALNDEINANARLNAELIAARREIELSTGRN